jgi:hypothetical protein
MPLHRMPPPHLRPRRLRRPPTPKEFKLTLPWLLWMVAAGMAAFMLASALHL